MAENREKTYVADVDRSIYDIRDAEHDAYRMESGLTPEIVDKLSKEKNDPVWMQQFRLQSLQIYNELRLPDWGPSLEGLDIDHIATYVRPNTKMQNDWANVPQDIKDFIFVFQLGFNETMNDSLAICQENFRLHWGQKLVNTLRALHEVKYAQGEDEEEETADFEF